ncbi:hypothetical protein Cob_v011511 [Colletotrichum orbiculare MAFF 240422]|uniref:Cullin N-terminal domain-containing protein n=1 Tax=Colletotrichum orbiculare (strain 104-T / ATCC 96160 / CBS 514.97 / LARS 414 / MAFF 240422) TaxID=1213857 RepID=A0A484FC35_COLOR|nr:hypothetical protein Cob_v011511 [Colletotrichum orbiculare MAFF 240422]
MSQPAQHHQVKPANVSKRDYQALWSSLACSYEQIHQGNEAAVQFDDVCRTARNLCAAGCSTVLYNDTIKWHGDFLTRKWSDLVEGVKEASDFDSPDEFLRDFIKVWNAYNKAVNFISGILTCIEQSGLTNAKHSCLEVFLDTACRSPVRAAGDPEETVLGLIVAVGYDHIYHGREEDADDAEPRSKPSHVEMLLSTCFRVFDELCETLTNSNGRLFHDVVGSAYLAAAGSFYAAEARTLAAGSSAVEFCAAVQRWLEEEAARCGSVLPAHMYGDVEAMVVDTVLRPHLDAVLDYDAEGVADLFDSEPVRQLSTMHRLAALVGSEDKVIPGVFKKAAEKRAACGGCRPSHES